MSEKKARSSVYHEKLAVMVLGAAIAITVPSVCPSHYFYMFVYHLFIIQYMYICVAVSLLMVIRSLPEMGEVRSRLDVNSESVMDKSALNDDQQQALESSSGKNCSLECLLILFLLVSLMLF